jgi:D-alanyl-D-alanine carboxypeptidase
MSKFSTLASVCLGVLFSFGAYADPSTAERVQSALEDWLEQRSAIEGVTGIAAYVSFGDQGPAIEAFAGSIGRGGDDGPVGPDTLFQMGSTSKSFAAAVVLGLEAAGVLSLDDTIGKWLPEYPAWKDVSLRRLLNMTSGIPNYSETEPLSRIWVEEPGRHLTAEELIDAVYPAAGSNQLPAGDGYYYSNTNYILAGLIASRASGKSYRDLVHELVIEPAGLHSTFFESGAYSDDVTARLAHGYFENPACTDYQPKDCEESWNQPMVGRDVRTMSLSWAQAAGGAISNPRDVNRWVRTMFSGRFVPPKQQAEWLSMISTRTGEAIAEVSADDPRGFALGLVRALLGSMGAQWFYEGETLGYRTLYVWFADEDIVITVQTNSQPPEGEDRLHDVIIAVYEAVMPHRAGK